MKRILLLIAFALGSVAYGGTALAGGDHGHGHDQPQTTQPEHKVTICHIPPGNPANAHTIRVDESALPAHLAHGDYLGPCHEQPGTTEPATTVAEHPTTEASTAPPTTKYEHHHPSTVPHTYPPTTPASTAPPTTAAATTVPETRPPTTVAPTTAAPTTAVATTTPVTAAPTTVAPTTAPSTTARAAAPATTAPTTTAAAAIAALPVTGNKAFRNAGVALLTLTAGVGLVFVTRRRRIS